jgi:hypothetical protein
VHSCFWLLFFQDPRFGEFPYVPAKCPNSGSLMAMGSGGNKKKRGSYFLGRYVPHGGKKISV